MSEYVVIEVFDDMEEDEVIYFEDEEDFFEFGESNQEEVDIGFDDMVLSEGLIQSEDEEVFEFNEFCFDDIYWFEELGIGYD